MRLQECKMPSLAELEEIWEQVKVQKEEKDNLQAANEKLEKEILSLRRELIEVYKRIVELANADLRLEEERKAVANDRIMLYKEKAEITKERLELEICKQKYRIDVDKNHINGS